MNPNLQKQQENFQKTLQRQQPLPRPPSTTHSTLRHINFYVHSVLSYLKDLQKPIRIDELNQKLDMDIRGNPELLDKILRNNRISFDGKCLMYKPQYDIKSKDDITKLLKETPNLAGIDISSLKESFPKVEEAAQELSKSGEIFLIRPKEDGPKIIFFNDVKVNVKIDDEFKNLWSKIYVPTDERELYDELLKAGLKPVSHLKSTLNTNIVKKNRDAEKKPSKRPFRRIKITNDYLEGIDLNLDPSDL